MRRLDARNQLSLEVSKGDVAKTNVDQLNAGLNFGKIEVGKYALWRHLEVPNTEIAVVPNYTAGTAAIVQGSRTVTLSGATLSLDFKGRYFTSQASAFSYEIVDVSGSTLTLKTEIQDVSASGLTYSIFKKWYRLPSDIRVILPDYEFSGMPTRISVHGYDEYWAEITGSATVTFIKDSKTATFSGATLLGKAFPGDMIESGSHLYRIRTVRSDTEILMANRASDNYTLSFTIKSDSPYKGRLIGFDDCTDRQILRYSYIRCLYPMVNDLDDTELPPDFDRCILDFAKAEVKRMNNSEGWANDMNLATQRIRKLENDNKDLVWQAAQTFAPVIPQGMGRSEGRRFGGFR